MTAEDGEKLAALVLRIDQTAAQASMIATALSSMAVGVEPADAVAGLGQTLLRVSADIDAIITRVGSEVPA